jgi:hypothetical protein
MSAEFGPSLYDRAKAAAKTVVSGGSLTDYKKLMRAECREGRELSFVLILCAALERLGGNIEPKDFEAVTDIMSKNKSGLSQGKDCLDEEIAGLKKLKAMSTLDGDKKETLSVLQLRDEYIRLIHDEDSGKQASVDKKLKVLK